jgi:hypothetical protein
VGARQARNYVGCRIKLITRRTAHPVLLDELWIDDRLYQIKITNEENQQVDNQFSSKQVLFIEVESEASYQPESSRPVENSKTKIVLGYRVGNKRRYVPINNFSEDQRPLAVA